MAYIYQRAYRPGLSPPRTATYACRSRRVSRRAWRLPKSVACAAVIACTGAFLLAGNVYGGGPGSVLHIQVHTGDSLWSVAQGVYGVEDDLRGRVDTIIKINQLDGATIQPGEELLVPAP